MMQQMAVVAGSTMAAQMVQDGMLGRSSNAAYVAALNQHVYAFGRSIGEVP